MPTNFVPGGVVLFDDDLTLNNAEVQKPLAIPKNLPIFSVDQLQIIYAGRVYISSEKPNRDANMVVNGTELGLIEYDSPFSQEQKYFKDNAPAIALIQQDFISRAMGLVPPDLAAPLKTELQKQLSDSYSQLKRPAAGVSPGKGLVGLLQDKSIFNTDLGCDRALLLDNKLYQLLSLGEYLALAPRSFEPAFYKKLASTASQMTPEELSKTLRDNHDYVNHDALPLIANKIWHSPRSLKIYLDGTYWIPEFREMTGETEDKYRSLLEMKIKAEAAR